ncbi:helix-turn-helix domain-containing protein [Galactobacter valiniphilus]|uniref:XRE family transcriptional regulator n=1 Tax=Galactobacter valiniphilus TaxID=2676122 RepID=A0A399J9T9_9MICC|nr:helix-turn-helix transcriptional regulator [Galactobacter valiniphilus]RII41994.1 XRE family transcriptional regulator [Galactobacter valiniphilus]
MMKQPTQINGIVRWTGVDQDSVRHPETKERKMVVLRQEIGEVLREIRQRQGRTLREVSHLARVSLGYLSEVERGQKEASSELLASIATALDVPLSIVLRLVSDRIAVAEGVLVPDTIPSELTAAYSTHIPDEVPDGLAPDLAPQA